MCFLVKHLGLGGDAQAGKKGNSLSKPCVLLWLSYTNLTESVVVTAEESIGGRGKNKSSKSRNSAVHLKESVFKNYDTKSHYCFYRQPLAHTNLVLSVPQWHKNRE